MRHYGNPYQPGTPQWNYQQVQNQLLNSQERRREEQRQRDFLNSQERRRGERRREEQRQRDAQIWAQRRREEQRQRDLQIWAPRSRRAGGHGSSAGLWILQIIVAVVALVIILSNIT